MTHDIVDIAVLGGGSTGLQFACSYAQSPDVSENVLILEAREEYVHDRNWSFWLGKKAAFAHRDILKKTWPAWSFSKDGHSHTHISDIYEYATIAAGDFYTKAQNMIAKDPRQNLLMGQHVTAIEKSDEGFVITTQTEVFRAKKVIDTRHLEPNEIEKSASYFQIFTGYEVNVQRPFFDTQKAGLMQEMVPFQNGLAFVYVLPFSKTQALVEYTIFVPDYVSPDILITPLQTYLSQHIGAEAYEITQIERAVLPMGKMPDTPFICDPDYIRAGSAAGFLKESTGYGFMRSYHWSQKIVKAIARGAILSDHVNHVPWLEKFMDRHFIRTIRCYPVRICDIFWSMAHKLPADCFVRFMSSQARFFDYIRVILAMPKAPFIKAFLKKNG